MKAQIHVGSMNENSVYAGYSKHTSVCTHVSGCRSSIHPFSCDVMYLGGVIWGTKGGTQGNNDIRSIIYFWVDIQHVI